MQDIEAHYTDMWKDSPVMAEAEREKLYLAMQIIKKLKFTLAGYYQDYITNQENGRLDEVERARMKRNLNKTL